MHIRTQCGLLLFATTLAGNASAQSFCAQTAHSTLLNPAGRLTLTAESPDSFSTAKYVVQGSVKDDQGVPVEGAALHIAREIVHTDSSGRFLARFSKRGPYPLRVAVGEFMTAGVYEVVSAPAEVSAESEDTATDARIVIRRVPPPQAKLLH